jgi:hypothetical protein
MNRLNQAFRSIVLLDLFGPKVRYPKRNIISCGTVLGEPHSFGPYTSCTTLYWHVAKKNLLTSLEPTTRLLYISAPYMRRYHLPDRL